MLDAPLSKNGTPLLKARESNKNQKFLYPDLAVPVSSPRLGNSVSPRSHFALLDKLLDILLDIKKGYLVTTRQVLYPDLAVPVSSPRQGKTVFPTLFISFERGYIFTISIPNRVLGGFRQVPVTNLSSVEVVFQSLIGFWVVFGEYVLKVHYTFLCCFNL